MTAAPRPRPARLSLLAALLCALMFAPAGRASAQEATWAAPLKYPGIIVFMRHAEAPGFGDPEGYNLEDCSTQRNLNAIGRQHARRIGEAFGKNGIVFQRVLTSPWCRCKETALLVMGGEAEVFAPLSNLVGRQEHTAEQVAALKAFMAGLDPNDRVLLVTHGSVINAMTGIQPATGEMIIVKPRPDGGLQVLATVRVE